MFLERSSERFENSLNRELFPWTICSNERFKKYVRRYASRLKKTVNNSKFRSPAEKIRDIDSICIHIYIKYTTRIRDFMMLIFNG